MAVDVLPSMAFYLWNLFCCRTFVIDQFLWYIVNVTFGPFSLFHFYDVLNTKIAPTVYCVPQCILPLDILILPFPQCALPLTTLPAKTRNHNHNICWQHHCEHSSK